MKTKPFLEKGSKNVLSSLIIPFRISQFLGLFPLAISTDKFGQLELQVRWFSIPMIWTIILAAAHVFATPIALVRYNAGHVLKTIRGLCSMTHHLVITLYIIYFLMRCSQLKELFRSIEEIIEKLKWTKPDRNLQYFAGGVSIFILVFAVSENTMFIYTLTATNMKEVGLYEPIQYETSNVPFLTRLQEYYGTAGWVTPFGYIFLILSIVKQALFCYLWNFVDAIIIVHCRMISFQFKSLLETASELVSNSPPEKLTTSFWEEIRWEFEKLCGLLKKWNAFISTPLLLSYVVNILLMAMHLSQWISSKELEGGHGMSMYASMTSSLLIVRTVMVTHYGSEIHENAHNILSLADKCASSTYSISLERLERKLAAQRIGVSAGGIFLVSRSLFASITSVIFTIEIFLLQAGQPSQSQFQSYSIGSRNGTVTIQ